MHSAGFDEKPSERVALLSQEGSVDRASGEITRGVVPKPHPYKGLLGNHPSRGPFRARAALLTQEGGPPAPTAFHQTRPRFVHSFIDRACSPTLWAVVW
jgi:hypothetical protein